MSLPAPRFGGDVCSPSHHGSKPSTMLTANKIRISNKKTTLERVRDIFPHPFFGCIVAQGGQ